MQRAQEELQLDTTSAISKIDLFRERIRQYERENIRGAQIRSRAQWVDSEETSKFFATSEKIYGEKTYISHLTHDGAEVSDQHNILHVVHDYYSNLYQEKAISNKACEHTVSAIDCQLSPSNRENCDCSLQIEELTAALKEMTTNKSPGLDGLTTEFYRSFWSLLSQDFFDVVTEIYASRRK